MESTSPIETTVPAEMSGRRLDEVLVALVPACTKARLQKLVRRGRVLVDGRRTTRSNVRVAGGEQLVVHVVDPASTVPRYRVVHADELVIVVDKPAGVVVHPTERIHGGTLAEQLAEEFGPLPRVFGAARPGIVHRLDRETSGLLVVGRTAVAMQALKVQFKRRSVEKVYAALVHGAPLRERLVIDAPIAPIAEHADRQQVDPLAGKAARTRVDLVLRLGDFALLDCRPETGRRHQIRVHLAALGHSIVGDKLYPPDEPWTPPEGLPPIRRHLLHARELAFRHPATGEPVRFEAPLPDDFAAVVEWLA